MSEDWLNGWHRTGDGVLIGTGVHCAGCGHLRGITSIALTGDETWPDREPDWPFPEGDCPVCNEPARRDPDQVDEAFSIVRALAGTGGVPALAQTRARARSWVARHELAASCITEWSSLNDGSTP